MDGWTCVIVTYVPQNACHLFVGTASGQSDHPCLNHMWGDNNRWGSPVTG